MTISTPTAVDAVFKTSVVPALNQLTGSLAGLASTVQTGSWTAALTDRGTVVEMNATTALQFIVPPNASVPFEVGTMIMICAMGTGPVAIVAGNGVTLRAASSLNLRAQYSTVAIRQRAINEWVCTGDFS